MDLNMFKICYFIKMLMGFSVYRLYWVGFFNIVECIDMNIKFNFGIYVYEFIYMK